MAEPKDSSPTAHDPAEEPLRRELSRLMITALALNGLIGAGIFGLPSKAAGLTGAFSPLMFVVCALGMATVMASFGQAASYFHNTGGPILYTREAFGRLVGFETGWVLYVGRVTALAANTSLMVDYLGAFFPDVRDGAGRITALFVILGALTGLNLFGLKQGAGTLLALTAAKLLPLLLFCLVGFAHLNPAAFDGVQLPAYGEFGSAAILLFYAYIGFEGALIPAGESRNPRRDMPRALFWTLGVTTIIYVLVQTICVMTLPELASTDRPLAASAAAMIGPAGATIMAVAAIVSITGNSASSVLTAPRMTYAMARDRTLPAFFAKVHPVWGTPHLSILFYGVLAFCLAASGTFTQLAVMSTLTRLLGYGLCILALPRLKKKFGDAPDALRLPGGFLIPVLALLVCGWLLMQVNVEALKVGSAFVVAGALMFWWAGRSTART